MSFAPKCIILILITQSGSLGVGSSVDVGSWKLELVPSEEKVPTPPSRASDANPLAPFATFGRCESSLSDPIPREVRGVGWKVHLTDRHPHSQVRYQRGEGWSQRQKVAEPESTSRTRMGPSIRFQTLIADRAIATYLDTQRHTQAHRGIHCHRHRHRHIHRQVHSQLCIHCYAAIDTVAYF